MQKSNPSPEQIAANRANARKSTGPRTDLGKAAASRNRTLHGFASGDFILFDDEDRDQYHDLLESLRAEHQPATETEDLLVIKLLQHHWLQQRAIGYQTQAFDEALVVWHERKLNLYLRYAAQHERAFNKVLAQLKELRTERRENEKNLLSSEIDTKALKQAALRANVEVLLDKADAAIARRHARKVAQAAATNCVSTTSKEIGFDREMPAQRQQSVPGEIKNSSPEDYPNAA